MKKSIKYAGIAAATLLAVAPVAAPVVSSTTNAQAATVSDDQGKQDAQVTEFGTQFADKTAKDMSANLAATDGSGKITLGTSNVTNGDFAKNNAGLITTTVATSDLALLDSKGTATATVAASYTDGSKTTQITTQNDLASILADTTYPEVKFTITLNYKNMNGEDVTKDFTVTATRDSETSQMTTANINFTTPLTVPLNSTTTSTTLDASNDSTVKDQNGNSVLTADNNVSAGTDFYDTYSAAIEAAKGQTPATTATTNVGTNSDVNDGQKSFLKAGTYYQVLTFTAATGSSLGDFLTNYTSQPAKYSVYVNGKQASNGYDFVPDINTDTGSTTVKVVRTINVSNSAEKWTVTDNKGVVTTKSDNAYYTLKNDDNATITNRALAKNTAWVTDQKRVDQDGNTQYRVATGEWINADDVTFSDKATTDEGAYTDVQSVNGKVTLDGPSSFIYMLYNDNGESISNRALAGDSAWYTDKKATNAAGVTVYRVATGEWVQTGSGVNFSAY